MFDKPTLTTKKYGETIFHRIGLYVFYKKYFPILYAERRILRHSFFPVCDKKFYSPINKINDNRGYDGQ